jgi:hypothetical protein
MDVINLLLQRSVIIFLAVVGAVIATAGNFMMRKGSRADPRLARLVLRCGYAVTWASVGIFIAVGFFGP